MTQVTLKLIGREAEQAALLEAFAATGAGSGGIVLLSGEAGVGKTALLETCLAQSELLLLKGQINEVGTPPYGPIAAALRAYLRLRPDSLAEDGPLAPYLALLLPELGPPAHQLDTAALREAICQTFAGIGRTTPAVVILDDLQWADNATLELLPFLANALAKERLLIVGTYRNEEIGRGHPLRRLRDELRRAHMLHEIVVEPLDQAGTIELATQIVGQPLGPDLATALYRRTEGLPLFVTELARALMLHSEPGQNMGFANLASDAALPIPDRLRDAVLLRLDGLPETALRLLHLAAVAGREFDIALVVELAGNPEGMNLLLERGLLVEVEPERGAFRHALTRDAIYSDMSWVDRRALHHQMAERLEFEAATPLSIAHHWLLAKEPGRARMALIAAAEQAAAIHAYRDAAQAAQRALELWPELGEDTGRLELLDRLGQWSQLCGLLPEAAQAWREVAEGRRRAGDMEGYALAERHVANVAELQGHWEQALAARRAAAQSFAACELWAEAATERLSAAARLRVAGQYRSALELLAVAGEEAKRAERPDLRARILGHEGNTRARMGQTAEGLGLVRWGLALALRHNMSNVAAEIYQRLADSLEHDGDYAGAKETYRTAFDFCQANAVPASAQLCIACLSAVLRQTGEWERAQTLCREVLASQHSSIMARTIANGMLGSLYAMRGQARLAQPLLIESAALARQIELAPMELLSAWGLAMNAQLRGADHTVAEHCRFILRRWEQTEDLYYVVPALRWAVTFFATTHADAEARACANALARIASATGQEEALSALAFALGEIALLEGNTEQAVQQFQQSLDLLRDVPLPFCRARTQLRAGVACAAAEQRPAAVAHLTDAYRAARKLGARPLATEVAQTLATLGEPLVERLGQGAASRLGSGDLTRRQREILQLIAQGQTNAEIARTLVLSSRTVESHVANVLATLNSRSRAEAVRRATELGLLDPSTPDQKNP